MEVIVRIMRNAMRKRLQHVFIVIGVVLGLSLIGPRRALSQITWVRMGVDGMRWQGWANGVQKALSRLEGVDHVNVSFENAQADIRLKAGHPLELMMLRLAVSDAGFIATWMRFEATGRLVAAEDGIAFKVTGTYQVIPVKSDDALEKLRQAVDQEGAQIVLVGLIPPGEEAAQIEQFTVP